MRTPEPSKVAAKLFHSLPPDGGVRAYTQMAVVDPTTGIRKMNYAKILKDVEIENLRGKEESVTLDVEGFQFYSIPSKLKSFANDEEIVKEYRPECIELIKLLTGATRVVILEHVVRAHRPEKINDITARQPAPLIHNDQSPKSALDHLHRQLPASDIPELLKHRFQIINLWRPVHHPAYDWPLALCDYRSVDKTRDTFPVALIYPDREGEMLGVSYNEHHKWKYLRGMTPDEFVLFKCFDSVQDGSVATFTPHTAFEDPSTPADAALRESIEIRALVFYN